jgi:hypothetical protein
MHGRIMHHASCIIRASSSAPVTVTVTVTVIVTVTANAIVSHDAVRHTGDCGLPRGRMGRGDNGQGTGEQGNKLACSCTQIAASTPVTSIACLSHVSVGIQPRRSFRGHWRENC